MFSGSKKFCAPKAALNAHLQMSAFRPANYRCGVELGPVVVPCVAATPPLSDAVVPVVDAPLLVLGAKPVLPAPVVL